MLRSLFTAMSFANITYCNTTTRFARKWFCENFVPTQPICSHTTSLKINILSSWVGGELIAVMFISCNLYVTDIMNAAIMALKRQTRRILYRFQFDLFFQMFVLDSICWGVVQIRQIAAVFFAKQKNRQHLSLNSIEESQEENILKSIYSNVIISIISYLFTTLNEKPKTASKKNKQIIIIIRHFRRIFVMR